MYGLAPFGDGAYGESGESGESGTPIIAGSISTVDASDISSMTGTLTAGSISTVDASDISSMTGTPIIAGSISTVDASDISSMTGTLTAGSISTVDASDTVTIVAAVSGEVPTPKVNVNHYTDLITSEHIDKPKFFATVEQSCQPFVDIIAAQSGFNYLYDLDVAVGSQLDVVGLWVGISRYLSEPLTGVYFTFDYGPGLDAGALRDDYSSGSELVALPDDYYRLLIKARILNDVWDGSISQAYTLFNIVFQPTGYNFFIQDNGNMSMCMGLAGTNTPPPIIQAMFTGGLFDLRPATVLMANYIWQASSAPMFMFDAPIASLRFAGLDNGAFAILS